MRGSLLALVATGCFARPGPPDGLRGDGGPIDGARSDGRMDAASTWRCEVADPFEVVGNPPPCGDWGTAVGNVSRDGRLLTTPAANVTDAAGCTTVGLAPLGTFTIELTALGIEADGQYVVIEQRFRDAITASFSLRRTGTTVSLTTSCNDKSQVTTPPSPSQLRFIRVLTSPGATPSSATIDILTSSDGVDFTSVFAPCGVDLSNAPATFWIASGTTTPTPSPPTTAWDNLQYDCMP